MKMNPRLRHIAVPITGCDTDDVACAVADRIALHSGADLHLVGGFEHPLWATSIAGELVYPPITTSRAELIDKVRASLERKLTRAADELEAATHTGTREGKPVSAVLDYLGDHTIDLVVTPSRGIGLFTRLLHSSVAGELSREAPIPVLVVEPDAGGREIAADGIHDAIIAVDDDIETAIQAATIVGKLVEPRGRVVLLHVASDEPEVPNPAPWLFQLEADIARLIGPRVTVSACIERGDVADAIARAADEMNASLVAVGSRPHETLTDRVFGTVADAVLASGGRVVLTIPKLAREQAAVESKLDQALDASFPASDPPSWSPATPDPA